MTEEQVGNGTPAEADEQLPQSELILITTEDGGDGNNDSSVELYMVNLRYNGRLYGSQSTETPDLSSMELVEKAQFLIGYLEGMGEVNAYERRGFLKGILAQEPSILDYMYHQGPGRNSEDISSLVKNPDWLTSPQREGWTAGVMGLPPNPPHVDMPSENHPEQNAGIFKEKAERLAYTDAYKAGRALTKAA